MIGGSALVFGWAVVDFTAAAEFEKRVVVTGGAVALAWRF